MIRLHPRTGRNLYCGPSAISFLTGLSTDDAAALIRKVDPRKRYVKGASTISVLRVLQGCGFGYINRTPMPMHRPNGRYPRRIRMTLGRWLEEYRRPRATYLVVAGNHFQVIHDGLFADSIVGKPVDLSHEGIRRRAHLEEVYELYVDRALRVRQVQESLERERREKRRAYNRAYTPRRKVRELEKAGVVEVDTHSFGQCVMVYPTKLEDHEDPYRGDHNCDNWEDALQRAQEYARLQGLSG